ncbi:hypothetical protein FRC02_002539 [Tulasnella sp. 418]|nr:hypothetical protein FRC02_002539 [Tulasnella sp. 418]
MTDPGPRKKAGKVPPKLPLSLFSGPAGSTSPGDKQAGRYDPLAPDPSTVHPAGVIDANVVGSGVTEADSGVKVEGVVVSLRKGGEDEAVGEQDVQNALKSTSALRVIVPFPLVNGAPASAPTYLSSSTALGCTYKAVPELSEGIKWAIENGYDVELDIAWSSAQAATTSSWEGLEEIVAKGVPDSVSASEDREPEGAKRKAPAIILANLLPPPHSLTIPIVKLLNHPTYLSYQAHTAALSFIPNVYLKFLPPSWEDPTPPSPAPGSVEFEKAATSEQDAEAKDEWKRRVKMFLGPALDAFGYSRIIFGSSPSLSSTSSSTPRDWYALAREVLAELGVEQEGIDAIFMNNAKAVYSR